VSPIDTAQIRNDLLQTLAELADIDIAAVGDDDRLREDLGLDSLQSMELLSRISDRYELDIDVEDVMDVQTVGDVVRELDGFLKAAAG
jgi:acyl carrier protein